MMHAGSWVLALWAATGAAAGDRAAAAAEPLLVVVEGARPTGPSPESIRRAIAEELGRTVVGPQDSTAKDALDVLLVTTGADSVTMQLRRAGTAVARRRVEAVPGGATGLQVVAWLAGNLVRDQASSATATHPAREGRPPVVADPPPPHAPEATPAARSAVAAAATTEAIAVPRTEPPPQTAEVTIRRASPAPSVVQTAEEDLRLGIQVGYGFATAATQFAAAFFPTARIELLMRMRGGWSSWFGLNVQGGWAAAGVSGGIVRRVDLVPGVSALEFGAGAGFLVGERAHLLLSPGGPSVEQRTVVVPVVHGMAAFSLATWLGEGIIALAANEELGPWDGPDLTLSVGGRVAF